MTNLIRLYTIERNLVASEIECVEFELVDENFPLDEVTEMLLHVRLGILNNSLTYIEQLIIKNLAAQPLPDDLNPSIIKQ
jgi:hypothetical protein